MATVPKTFADDFALVERHWIQTGEDTPDGIAEIKDAIRIAFKTGGEAATYWTWRIADEANALTSAASTTNKTLLLHTQTERKHHD